MRVVSGEAPFNQIWERRVSCEHRYHRKSLISQVLGRRCSCSDMTRYEKFEFMVDFVHFQHRFLGVFCIVDLPLTTGTTSSKRDVIGWILREISTTAVLMNQRLAGAASGLSLKKKQKSCAVPIYKVESCLTESLSPLFQQPPLGTEQIL